VRRRLKATTRIRISVRPELVEGPYFLFLEL